MNDSFSKIEWALLLKEKSSQTISNFFEKVLIPSQRKPNLNETDRGTWFSNRIFTDLLNKSNIQRYSGYTSSGAVFAKTFDRTIRDLLNKPVFERGDANWVDVSPTKTNQIIVRSHSSTELTPFQASLKNTERFVYQNLVDKRKKKNQI